MNFAFYRRAIASTFDEIDFTHKSPVLSFQKLNRSASNGAIFE